LNHLAVRNDEIIQAINRSESPIFALAGFNESLVREGVGLLQEIHIFSGEELDLEPSIQERVGKLSAPFPSVIFLPSGKVIRLPLYDEDGGSASPDRVVASSICQWRHSDAIARGLHIVPSMGSESEAQNNDSDGTRNREGQSFNPSSSSSNQSPNYPAQEESEPPGDRSFSSGGAARSNRGSQDGTAGRPIPENATAGHEGESGRNQELRVAEDSLEPEDPSTTQRLHSAHFDVTAAVHHASSEFVQNLQLTGDLSFKVRTSKSHWAYT
jgi:hypothetical protein